MESKLRFSRDGWLTDCVGVDAFTLSAGGEYSFSDLETVYPVFMSAKIRINDGDSSAIENLGFYEVNRQITLSMNLQAMEVQGPISDVLDTYRFEVQQELFKAHSFAPTFLFDRFTSDKKLPSAWSIKIKQRWLENKDPEKSFLVVYIDDKVAGFILFKLSTICTVELVSVLEPFRGAGVGGRLFRVLYDFCRQNSVYEIFVGTQHNNAASLALYHKVGFQKYDEKLVYHYCKGINLND